VVVSKVDPLRIYLFKGGVLPFGTLKEEAAASTIDGCPAAADASTQQQQCSAELSALDDLIVNLWRNRRDAVIWKVDDFEVHLRTETGSSAAFDALWAAVQRLIGAQLIPLLLDDYGRIGACYLCVLISTVAIGCKYCMQRRTQKDQGMLRSPLAIVFS